MIFVPLTYNNIHWGKQSQLVLFRRYHRGLLIKVLQRFYVGTFTAYKLTSSSHSCLVFKEIPLRFWQYFSTLNFYPALCLNKRNEQRAFCEILENSNLCEQVENQIKIQDNVSDHSYGCFRERQKINQSNVLLSSSSSAESTELALLLKNYQRN